MLATRTLLIHSRIETKNHKEISSWPDRRKNGQRPQQHPIPAPYTVLNTPLTLTLLYSLNFLHFLASLPGKREGGRLCLFCGPGRPAGGWNPGWGPRGFLSTAALGCWGGGTSGRDITPAAELTMSRTVSYRSWLSGMWTAASCRKNTGDIDKK